MCVWNLVCHVWLTKPAHFCPYYLCIMTFVLEIKFKQTNTHTHTHTHTHIQHTHSYSQIQSHTIIHASTHTNAKALICMLRLAIKSRFS